MTNNVVRNSAYRQSFGLSVSGVVKKPHKPDLDKVAVHPNPKTRTPKPWSLNTESYALKHEPYTLHPPKPSTTNIEPCFLLPQPSTLNTQHSTFDHES